METIEKTKRRETALTRPKRPTVSLESLIYEVMDGEPIYYKGYRDVLSGKKTAEEIMGSSTLQWIICSYFMQVMYRQLDSKKYWFASSEAGVHLNHRNNLAHDVAIYDRAVLTPDKINTRYADVPAKIGIKVDVKADISKENDANYVNRKTRKLLDFGSEKIIWIFTSTQQIMVAEQGADAWLTMDWHRDLELTDGQFFNLGQYLADEGITVEVD
ncbi:MAG: Uma2 family endonuclease [Cytophagales bacterium]|nr:MAG: Uma2 family endonuclease [Cytophagales bacterium]